MKKFILTLATSMLVFGVQTGSVSAWTFKLKGSGACQPDGSYIITWTVNNKTERQALKITNSSQPSVVAVGTEVPKHSMAEFKQKADGTKPTEFTLSLKGNWQGDLKERERNAKVKLHKACEQPIVPPTAQPGRGGEKPVTPVVASAQQVVAPVGAVDAGTGSSNFNLTAIAGIVTSVAIAATGLRRYVKA